MSILFISEGKLFRFNDGKISEIKSNILDSYIERVKSAAKRKEWKTSGSGAAFLGSASPIDAQSAVENIKSRIDCVCVKNGAMIFTQTIDGASGIYTMQEGFDDGIVLSDGEHIYRDFSVSGDDILVSAFYAGEAHIASVSMNSPDCTFFTEGESRDRYPVRSKTHPELIYYSSAGLMIREQDDENSTRKPPFMSVSQMIEEINSSNTVPMSPSTICELNTELGEIREILQNDRFDYIKPMPDDDGSLYYIKKPYIQTKSSKTGCLVDILLFPFRLIGALINFLSFFSLKYSGKSLKQSSNAVKNKSDKQIFIDGNLIDAEKSYKENSRHEKDDPGIIPQSFELCRLSADGKTEVIKRGVIAYALGSDGIYYSDGSSIKRIRNGKTEKICHAEKVTYIYPENNA